jgi:hypothetical protein
MTVSPISPVFALTGQNIANPPHRSTGILHPRMRLANSGAI